MISWLRRSRVSSHEHSVAEHRRELMPRAAGLAALIVLAVAGAPVSARAAALDDIQAAVPAGYYRMPALRGDVLIFVSEGDLWRVPAGGGRATRLTTHAGEELHPAISPDGKTLAFTATYEGPTEVYTMPIDGGLPTRRTWGASRTTFVGWTPDNKVLYSTREYSTLPSSQLVTIDLATNARERIPLYEADQGAHNADSSSLFFTRLPFQNSQTKRYKGGYIQQLWRFDRNATEAVPLTTDFPGTSKDPMIAGDWSDARVVFATDRDGIMNIWSMLPDGKDLKQHTFHKDFDVATPEIDNTGGAARVVYQHGADIFMLNVASGATAAVPITLSSDFDQMRERWIKNPASFITSFSPSPDGDRLAIAARGRVFVAPAKQGRFVEVTKQLENAAPGVSTTGGGGVRYRTVRFTPDGKSLLALSDRSGEVEFWTLPANGVGDAAQLTSDSTVLRWEGVPNPDGTLLAHHDKDQRLFITTIATKETKKIAESKIDNFAMLSWSPDGKFLAFVENADNLAQVVRVYSVDSGAVSTLTSDRWDSFAPRFSPDGKWLYFLSDRNIRTSVPSPWGPLAPQPFFDRRTKVYAYALQPGTRSPWQPKDELMAADKDKKEEDKAEKKDDTQKPILPADGAPAADAAKPAESKDEKKDDAKDDKKDSKKDEKKKVKVEIAFDSLQSRLIEVPVPAGNYSGLAMNDKALFFLTRDSGPEPKSNLVGVAIANEKIEIKTIVPDVRGFELTDDGKKIAVRKDDKFFIIDAAAATADLADKGVDLSGWTMSLAPERDWAQMYADAWRLLRDYFYARNMHGVDWKAVRAKYEPLIARVRSRAELNDVLAQVTGELSALHHFVRGGDLRQGEDRIGLAYLGGILARDEAKGGHRVESIYEFDPDEVGEIPPLARFGVEVKVGDVITHINGVPTLSVPDPNVLLRNQAGKQVLLRVQPAAKADGSTPPARDVIVVPIDSGADLDIRYNAWQVSRRRMVETLGDNQIGYVHLRAMGPDNIAEWAKGFFPVFNRQGLIIDVRRNQGGNIDSWILGHLLRRPWMFWNQRIGQQPLWNMQYAFRGHVVVLCDPFTASDGETFSGGFQRLGLGKVIGMRTWGGMIWLTSSNTLVDEGLAAAGEFGVFGPEGLWLIEGHGVDPDIVVDNLPHATFKGEDAQLNAAIEHLKKLIAEKPVPPVVAPALPDKSFPKK